MTTSDIRQVQIMLTDKEGHHYFAVQGNNNTILLNFIVEVCKFVKVQDNIFETIKLEEIIEHETDL